MSFQQGRCYIKSCFGPLLFQSYQRSIVFKCVFICVNLSSVISSLPPLSKLLQTLWLSEMEASKVFFFLSCWTFYFAWAWAWLRTSWSSSSDGPSEKFRLVFPSKSLKWLWDIFNIVSSFLSYQIGLLITALSSHANSIFAHYFPSKVNSLHHTMCFSISTVERWWEGKAEHAHINGEA